MHFGCLKIRFMPSHEPHCPIVIIQGQSSKVMGKDQIRDNGERSKVKVKRERHRSPHLKWASSKRTFAVSWNDLYPVFTFWWPENTIYAESRTPLPNSSKSRSKIKGHAKRPTSWTGWKVIGHGQTNDKGLLIWNRASFRTPYFDFTWL